MGHTTAEYNTEALKGQNMAAQGASPGVGIARVPSSERLTSPVDETLPRTKSKRGSFRPPSRSDRWLSLASADGSKAQRTQGGGPSCCARRALPWAIVFRPSRANALFCLIGNLPTKTSEEPGIRFFRIFNGSHNGGIQHWSPARAKYGSPGRKPWGWKCDRIIVRAVNVAF
jgi:hypothetical protein